MTVEGTIFGDVTSTPANLFFTILSGKISHFMDGIERREGRPFVSQKRNGERDAFNRKPKLGYTIREFWRLCRQLKSRTKWFIFLGIFYIRTFLRHFTRVDYCAWGTIIWCFLATGVCFIADCRGGRKRHLTTCRSVFCGSRAWIRGEEEGERALPPSFPHVRTLSARNIRDCYFAWGTWSDWSC